MEGEPGHFLHVLRAMGCVGSGYGAKVRKQKSAVFRADHPSFPFPVAVKHVHHGTGSPALQFEALKRVAEALANDKQFRVPRPLALDESTGVLLMEWIELPSLEQRLQHWRTTTRCALQHVANAGQWLRRLHDSRNCIDGFVESERLMENLFEALRGAPELQHHGTLCTFLSTLRRLTPAVSKVPVPTGLQHGDYKPANVLTGPKSTVGIDCHALHDGLVISDLSQFLNHLHFTVLAPQGMRFLHLHERLDLAFLSGYADAGRAIERAVPRLPLAWVRLHAVARFWITDAKSGLSSLRFSYRSWCYRRLGKILDRELAGSLIH